MPAIGAEQIRSQTEQFVLSYSYASISWFRFKGFVWITSQAAATPQDGEHCITACRVFQVLPGNEIYAVIN
tara:strand:- start:460 stop:672 length:213 start_codon:yes stop_codon:yes gene_type:complete